MARIVMTLPARPGSPTGNAVTAERWARILRALGHRVTVVNELAGEPVDVLVALHATKSCASVERARRLRPTAAIVVALTGTDLYQDLPRNRATLRSLDLADRLVVLQPLATRALPREVRRKAVTIRQSTSMPRAKRPRRPSFFDVVVLANLRKVKDPLRAALAARHLPPDS